MGPLLVLGDAPSFVPKKVEHDYRLDEKNVPDTTGEDSGACCGEEGGGDDQSQPT
jgi:hypothetical protein